jgi:hypothetical protein
MIVLHVRRSKKDRGRFCIDESAWWRGRSWRPQVADAHVDGRRYVLRRIGFLGQHAQVEDAVTGEVVASWQRRHGHIEAEGAALKLSREKRLGRAWTLSAGDEVARFEPKALTGGELRIRVRDTGLPRLLLVFSAWITAAQLSDDATATATATA